jgi:hypothetical protein
VSSLLHATVYMFLHNLLNVLVQIEYEMGFQKKVIEILNFSSLPCEISEFYCILF